MRPPVGRIAAVSPRPEAGFSLVEVMASLAIFLIAMVAVFATFTSQQKTFTDQSRVAEMQQNLRQGVEFLMRDVRMAGYGIPDNVAIPNGTIATGVTSVRALYAKDNTTGPDQVYVLYRFDMDSNQPPTQLNSDMAAYNTGISVDNVYGFDNGDLILVATDTNADMFQVTATPAGNSLPHNTSGYNAVGAHPAFPGYLVATPAVVAKARFNRFFIDNTTDPDHPTLMVDRLNGYAPQPVADDIEDLQLTYGIDTGGDGVVDAWTSAPGTPSQIRQVRLQMSARARMPDREWRETRPALGNRPGGTTTDGYRRRVIDVVIDVRNSGI